ncbi:hypothetical protein [Streptococcus suis]|uniref:hypothetical protein n=1 Tax=Streptococcus suis TaxID=1307 RepID=UPI000CF59DD8|nr:hypothetical protein [Streptococcus suis]
MKKVWKIVAAVTVVLALLGFIAYKMTFGELVAQTPQVNEWYRLSPEGVVDSQGNQAHGLLRIGKEKNKVMVSFFGGGVSINEETAFQGNSPEIVQNKLYQDQKRND